MARTRHPHRTATPPQSLQSCTQTLTSFFGCSSEPSRVRQTSGREHPAKLALRVLRAPREPAPSPKPTAGANRTTRACPARGPGSATSQTPQNATSETLQARDPRAGPQARAAARARYVPEHRCSQKDPRPDPTSGQSPAGVSCAGNRSHGRRRLGG